MSEPDYGSETTYILQEGVYMFGGVRGKTSDDYRLSNAVYVLKIGAVFEEPCWSELETKGKPPVARFHHGMAYYRKGNYIVVYGGRRYAVYTSKERNSDSEFVRQIAVLKMDSLEWLEVKFQGYE